MADVTEKTISAGRLWVIEPGSVPLQRDMNNLCVMVDLRDILNTQIIYSSINKHSSKILKVFTKLRSEWATSNSEDSRDRNF